MSQKPAHVTKNQVKAERYGNSETGTVLNSGIFSEHWSRKWVPHVTFFNRFPVSLAHVRYGVEENWKSVVCMLMYP
jgi:hypothetical protein